MERNFYNAFYKRTGSIFVSCLLAKIAYYAALLRYCILKRFQRNHRPAGLDRREAEALLWEASPKPDISYTIAECPHGDVDLSVIVPVYNYRNLLKNCLDSIVHQRTGYSYEMIFVDDGSTDGSSEVLREYEGIEGVHIIRQENGGISAARNAALNIAKGRYIMFVDCDDYLEPDAAEILLQKAYEEDCDIVEGAYYTFGPEGGAKRKVVQREILLKECKYNVLMAYTGYPWAKVYKRELFGQVRFPEHAWFEDTLVKLILFRACKRYAYVTRAVYGYRKYEGNFTETQVKSARGLEHYWLVAWMAALSEEKQIGDRDSLYLALLYHLGAIYEYRIANTQEKLQEAAFVMGGGLLRQYHPQEGRAQKLPFMYRELEKAYGQNDFAWWKLICRFM